MAKIISIGNQKGGCGKTTTAVNLSVGLAMLGADVLMIDMDPQGNASTTFGINIEDIPISMADILMDDSIEFKYNIFKKGAVHIAPSNPSLNYAEQRLHDMSGRASRLKARIKEIEGFYDYIIIDCPPNIGLLTTNALMASTAVIIPVDAGFYSLMGVRQFLARVEDVSRVTPGLEIMGILVTNFVSGSRLSEDVLGKVKECFNGKVFETVIRRDLRLAEAPGYLASVFEYDWAARGSSDYLKLSREVLRWKT